MSFSELVLEIVKRRPGVTDRELAEAAGCVVQQVNGECRHLEQVGKLKRRKEAAEPIANYVRRAPLGSRLTPLARQ